MLCLFLEIVAIILVDVLSECACVRACVCFYYMSGSFLFCILGKGKGKGAAGGSGREWGGGSMYSNV